MLRIDFGQSLFDHCGVLILVQPVGYIGDKPFKSIYDEISGYRTAQVPNTTRRLLLRYAKRVTPQFLEWGNFHLHKRVLGLICVGKCSEVSEVEKLENAVNEIKNPFSAILFNTRCFVFGCKSTNDVKVRKDFALIGGDDPSRDLQNNLAEFVASLFNVLESKRLSKLSEKIDKIVLIKTHVEHESLGGENDSRTMKRKTVGRSKKYTGDLCMLAGLPQDALSQYLIAGEHLRSANDVLWLAGAFEGQCAASLALISDEAQKSTNSLILPTECAANSAYVTSNGLGSEVDESKFRNPSPLSKEDMVDRLSEALKLYNRFKGAAVLETEANLKFTRLLIRFQKPIEASIALQNSMSVNISLTELEKITRFNTAAILYDEIGFKRKAAFFSKISAAQCVSHQLQKPLWQLSYNFLMDALEGYRIHQDQNNVSKGYQNGWPYLQTRLLNDLILTSRYLGDPSLYIRHVTFLLQTMHEHLSDQEKRELSTILESSFKEPPASPREKENNRMDKLDMNNLSLTNMPVVRSFQVQPLAPHMRPVRMRVLTDAGNSSGSPFIFSTLRQNRKEARKVKRVKWVCGDIGQVSLDVFNPMPFELKATNMVLCVEGAEFEPYPTCLSLPAKAGPHTVILLGIPKSVGSLRITGYTITVFGVESTCKLTESNMKSKDEFPVIVDVVASMPVLQVSTSLPKVRSRPPDPDAPQSAPLVTAVTLYAGQSIKGTVKLENTSKLPVDSLSITIGEESVGADELFSFDDKEIASKFPLLPGNSTDITVTITGARRFPQCLEGSEKAKYDPEATWGLTGSIHFEYSTEAFASNMYRKVTMAIDVTVVPSLLCGGYQIIELPRDKSHCLLMFDVVNKTSNDMELTSSLHNSDKKTNENESFTEEVLHIQANNINRVTIKLPRLASSIPAENSGNEVETYSKPQRQAKCKQYVCDLVKLHWNLPVCRASGCGNVDNLKLDAAMLEVLSLDPIVFEASINGKAYDSTTSNEVTVSISSIVDLVVTVVNESDESRGPLLLSIDPYQEQAFGCPVTELDGKVTWFGALKSRISELSPGSSLCHRCSLMFLYTGQYTISISCSDAYAEQVPSNDTSSAIAESSHSSETLRRTSVDSLINETRKSWTFSPPIKIHVVE
ncbi:trafficking protein particle complex subunit 9-like [Acropora millepora]|uniref:trafficking protein particle complex subunit 9-like n=1 Tax=Acropora millepora TaxID=45264 RepID=UPI001CF5C010|nr:trafficking protein particle complex subunit 9-like [Acropora millepora]